MLKPSFTTYATFLKNLEKGQSALNITITRSFVFRAKDGNSSVRFRIQVKGLCHGEFQIFFVQAELKSYPSIVNNLFLYYINSKRYQNDSQIKRKTEHDRLFWSFFDNTEFKLEKSWPGNIISR